MLENLREYIIEGLCEDETPAQVIDCLVADLQELEFRMVEMKNSFNALRTATKTEDEEVGIGFEPGFDDLGYALLS